MKCFEATVTSSDISSINNLLESGNIGFGDKVALFENKYAKYSNKRFNIGLNSASSAVFCLFAYLYDKYGSCNVYTPSIGFISPAWAAKKNGHNVYFTDVDKNLVADFNSYQIFRKNNLRKGKKNVFMPVLYGGISNIFGLIENVREASSEDLVIVDSAHCLNPAIESDYTFFSFHPVKPLAMSTGGLLSTNDKEASEYIKRYRNFGRQSVDDSYDVVGNGFNFYMNNLNAVLGLSQLSTCFENVKIRRNNFEYLKKGININVGYFTEHDEGSSYYLATLVLNTSRSTDLRKKLRSKGLCASFHYPFLHETKLFYTSYSLPFAESLENRIINLPIHQNLKKEHLSDIMKTINS